MGLKKLIRFAEIKTFHNALEYPQNMPGNWKIFFQNINPITLELACGKGEYTVGLARMHADQNFIGIDLKSNRMWVGAKKALHENLTNVCFVRSQIEKLTDYFDAGEVHEIWITFPDPQLAVSRTKKRLTHPRFLRLYQQIIGKDGIIHLKTDSPDLYNFTKQVIQLFGLTLLVDLDDVYSNSERNEELNIQTHYEKLDIAQSNRIHYLQFLIDQPLPDTLDEQLISEINISTND